jgi:hypothetical protein
MGGVSALSVPISIAETDRFRLKYQAFYSNEILTRLQPMTGSTGFTRLLCGRNHAADGADSTVRKITLKSPNMPPAQALLKGPKKSITTKTASNR